MNAFHVLVVLFAGYMLVKHVRRGVLFLAPGLVRISGRPGVAPATPMQLRAGEELAGLGFAHLGSRREDGALGGLLLASDAWANEEEGAFADVFDHRPREGVGPWAYFLSPFPDGALVLTANHPRLARETPMLQIGGLAASTLAATWAAHRVAVQRFAAGHGRPSASASLEARQAAARAWYRGPGRSELRRLFLVHFLDTVLALILIAGGTSGIARSLRSSP
jgi:hypothetical protein